MLPVTSYIECCQSLRQAEACRTFVVALPGSLSVANLDVACEISQSIPCDNSSIDNLPNSAPHRFLPDCSKHNKLSYGISRCGSHGRNSRVPKKNLIDL